MSGIINLCDGQKGGVGKSIVAMAMIEYYLDKNRDFVPVDADRYNPDVSKRYGNLAFRFATFTEDEQVSSINEIPGQIIDFASERDVIVSLPAGVGIPLNKWIDTVQATSEGNGASFVRWFVTSGTYESLNLFKVALEKHGDVMPFFLVKNWRFTVDWSEVETFDGLSDLIDKYNVQLVDFPRLSWRIANHIQKNNWRFSEAKTDKSLNLIDAARINKFLNHAYSAFESTGLFTDA